VTHSDSIDLNHFEFWKL